MGSAESTFIRGAVARQQAAQLVVDARALIFSCERECDYSAILIWQAREARRALAGNFRLLARGGP